MRRHWAVLLSAALVLALAIPVLTGGPEMLVPLRQLSLWGLVLMLGMIFIGWNLNAMRLKLMLHQRAENLGHGKALATIMVTECTFNATPGGSGAPFALAGLLRRHGVSGATSAAVFAVDQLTDMVVFVTLLPAVLFYGLSRYLEFGSLWQFILPLVLLVGALAMTWAVLQHYRALVRRLGRILAAAGVSVHGRWRWARRFLRFRDGIQQTLAVPKSHLMAMFLLCALHWLLRYSVLFVAVRAMGGDLSWVYGFLVQMVAMGAGHLTLLPGGAGGSEVAGAAMLAPVLGASMTGAAVLVWRFMTFHLYLIVGGMVMIMLGGREVLVWLRGESS